MNKLHVALKLLQLLNERRSINSRTVADELNVSLRTAQRYLMELSILPCVINTHDSRTFTINPDYALHDALKNPIPDSLDPAGTESPPHRDNGTKPINRAICMLCRNNMNNVLGTVASAGTGNNLAAVDRLVSMVEKRLVARKCKFYKK